MSYTTLTINPDILKWAREESGYELFEIAKKLDISEERYKQWEIEGRNIPLGKLKTLSGTFKRQLAVFLLPETPNKVAKPHDYRNLNPVDSRFSKKVLEAIRNVNYFCETAQELQGVNYWEQRYQWMSEAKSLLQDGHYPIHYLRDLINISIDDQLKFKSDSDAFRLWRNAFEDRLGILVFQFAMPIKEVEGFCLMNILPYAIVVNSNYPYTHRIFTLFHELAHILHNQSGICLHDKVDVKQKEEWSCNEFAGNFLAPDALIEQTDDLKVISYYASRLNISREAYLRRMKEEQKISSFKFFKILEQIKATYSPPKKTKGFVKPEVKSRACRGETLYSMVLEAMYNNRISYTQAASILNLNLNRLLNAV
ncbi:MAG: XRE family transcriptional regulator [Bacteroidota bacterium]